MQLTKIGNANVKYIMYKGARRLTEATKQSEAINSISVKHRTIVGFMGGATPLQLELAFPGQATRNSVGKKTGWDIQKVFRLQKAQI